MKPSIFATFVLGASTHLAVAQPAPATEPTAPTSEDLSRAADAAADVAAMPAGEPAADGAKASSDDIDLSALGLDPSASSFDDKLNIYGFADVGWSGAHWVNELPGIRRNTLSFAVGNMNIYLAKNLTPKARALLEVRFTFLPNASSAADGSKVSTLSTEVANAERPAQWGGVVVERAYVEYDLTEHLTIRAGRWLSPYGIWNIDHGSPAIIAVNRPYIIGEQLIPEHQTGLDLFGNYYNSGFKINYHLTGSNGRGASDAQLDQDNNLALGVTVDVETPYGVRFGGSYYRGRYTGFEPTLGVAGQTYLEDAYAGNVQFDHAGLHLQAEVVARGRHYDDGARTPTAAGFAPDADDFGYYVLGGYRFDKLWSVMPYAYYEHYRPQERPYFSGIDDITAGLNFRPSAGFVLKLQGVRAKFSDGPELLAGQKYYVFSAQASWVF